MGVTRICQGLSRRAARVLAPGTYQVAQLGRVAGRAACVVRLRLPGARAAVERTVREKGQQRREEAGGERGVWAPPGGGGVGSFPQGGVQMTSRHSPGCLPIALAWLGRWTRGT